MLIWKRKIVYKIYLYITTLISIIRSKDNSDNMHTYISFWFTFFFFWYWLANILSEFFFFVNLCENVISSFEEWRDHLILRKIMEQNSKVVIRLRNWFFLKIYRSSTKSLFNFMCVNSTEIFIFTILKKINKSWFRENSIVIMDGIINCS